MALLCRNLLLGLLCALPTLPAPTLRAQELPAVDSECGLGNMSACVRVDQFRQSSLLCAMKCKPADPNEVQARETECHRGDRSACVKKDNLLFSAAACPEIVSDACRAIQVSFATKDNPRYEANTSCADDQPSNNSAHCGNPAPGRESLTAPSSPDTQNRIAASRAQQCKPGCLKGEDGELIKVQVCLDPARPDCQALDDGTDVVQCGTATYAAFPRCQ
jgi:hypothetical protein